MKHLPLLLSFLFLAGCCGTRRYEILGMTSVKDLGFSVNYLGELETAGQSSCQHTTQPLSVPAGVYPKSIAFRVYPIDKGQGTMVVQLVDEVKGKPGVNVIDEWVVRHESNVTLWDDFILLHLSRPLVPGNYWVRFTDCGTGLGEISFNCVLMKSPGKLGRYVNREGDRSYMPQNHYVIRYGLME